MKEIIELAINEQPEEWRDIAIHMKNSFENLSVPGAAAVVEMNEVEKGYAAGFAFGVLCATLKEV